MLITSPAVWRFQASLAQRALPMLVARVACHFSTSGTASGTGVTRTAISLLGSTNAGKSVLMNLLTQSQVSLVHDTAGTTADPKVCVMELHGRIGPVRLLDTPGINEKGELGDLKRAKAFETIGQSDVAVIVADPFAPETSECVADIITQIEKAQSNKLLVEGQEVNDPNATVVSTGDRPVPLPLLVFNLRRDKLKDFESQPDGSVEMLLEDFEKRVIDSLSSNKSNKKEGDKKICLPPTLAVDFTNVETSRDRVIGFLERHADPRPKSVSVLPEWLSQDTHTKGYSPTVFLNIPMDQQTPGMRLLRPQAMVQEALIRNFVSTYCYRMDLGMARSDDPKERQTEKERFLRTIGPLLKTGDMPLLITDSQAIDIVAPWTLLETGDEIPITTFSITMIRYLSGGRLGYFVDGLRQLDDMIAGHVAPRNMVSGKWKILIAEACNHTRLNMEKQCADIGTVQLPNHLTAVLGQEHVEFEYMFGKHVIADPNKYDLVVHCGACMLTHQQTEQRVGDLMAAGVPATNYGLLLSRIQSPRTLTRVLKPWGIDYSCEAETADPDHLVV